MADSERPDVEARAAFFAAAIAIALAALTIPHSQDFPLDDAWIHLAYAKSVRLGDGLSYNPGDWETGFSSPLWAMLLAIWPVGQDPVLPVKLLGMLLHGLTAWLGAQIALGLAKDRATLERPIPVMSLGLLAGALIASTPTLLQASTSGMEVPLCSALVLATSLTMIQGRTRAAAVLGFLSVLARPEALIFLASAGGLLGVWLVRKGQRTRAVAAFAAAGGAAAALGAWVIYCLAISGYPWPNTQYVKGQGGGLGGLAYVAEEVLPWQAWIVSLTGVALVVLAIARELRDRRCELSVLTAATAITIVAIAVTRPLHPGVGFYESRYFMLVAAIPSLVMPFALIGMRRWIAGVLVVPVAIASGLQISSLHERGRELEDDTHEVHTAVARHVAANLPGDAIVAAEGAGAMRVLTPRTMTIVDLVGLNDREAAHRHFDRRAKLCHFVNRRPTHMVMPEDWVPLYASTFVLRPMAAFVDDEYNQVQPPRRHTVVVLAVEGTRDGWTDCAD